MHHPAGTTVDPLNGTGIHRLFFHHHTGRGVTK